MWDVFISHASEDKDQVARPLAEELRSRGFSVWYDEFSLSLGDSLRRKIDVGLRDSRYGVVLLSKKFLTKEWPQRELDGLTSRETVAGKVILPVWHQVTREDIAAYSVVLADRVAIATDRGIGSVADAIEHAIREDTDLASRGSLRPVKVPRPDAVG
ncbi:MAG TPA: toll/interleukin-1 receptor domain-containing protein, partial [Longimicrobium sp.]|nr:toll/interleukin-1 receptor domain-containing protein [Longimicrobium sp.]